MTDVFISYSRRDIEIGKRLHARLTETDHDIWMDWEDIPPTADWWAEIREGIEEADNFVLIMSPDSIGSPVCQLEIETAITNGKRIIPLFYRDPDYKNAFKAAATRAANDDIVRRLLGDHNVMKLSQDNWQHLGLLNWVFFNDDDDFEQKFAELLDIIDTDLEHTKTHTRLLTRALEWDRSGRSNEPLLSGAQIQEAEEWLSKGTRKSPQPTQLQSEYIAASRAHQQRLQRNLLIGVTAALLVSIGTSILAGFQYFAAQASNANAVAAANVAQQSQATAENAASIAMTSQKNSEHLEATAQQSAFELGTERANVASALREQAVAATQDASLANAAQTLVPIAVVTVETGAYLNVRQGPSFQDPVIELFSPMERLRVLGFAPDDASEGGWVAVQLPDDRIGYVSSLFVVTSDSLQQVDFSNFFAAESIDTPQPTMMPTATAEASDSYGSGIALANANVRSGPSLTFDLVGETEEGQELVIVSLLETEDEGAWVEVLLDDDATGFMSADLVLVDAFPAF